MGSNYSEVRDFRRRFNDGLEKVQRAWPGLDATPTDKGLLIKPSAPQDLEGKNTELRDIEA